MEQHLETDVPASTMLFAAFLECFKDADELMKMR